MSAGRLYYSSALARFRGDEVVPYAHFCIVWRETEDQDNPAIHAETPDFDDACAAYEAAKAIIAIHCGQYRRNTNDWPDFD